MVNFSRVENINNDNLIVYPNPIEKGKKINVRYVSQIDKPGSILSIINIFGEEVYTKKQNLIKGTNTMSLEPNLLKAGTYILSIKTATTSLAEKLVVPD